MIWREKMKSIKNLVKTLKIYKLLKIEGKNCVTFCWMKKDRIIVSRNRVCPRKACGGCLAVAPHRSHEEVVRKCARPGVSSLKKFRTARECKTNEAIFNDKSLICDKSQPSCSDLNQSAHTYQSVLC